MPLERAAPEPSWLPPDNTGISTASLTDPSRSTLRGKRLRRALDRPTPLVDAWPITWRELLAHWVRRAQTGKHYRYEQLMKLAGASRANAALQLLQQLLADGLVEVEERRDPQRGWHTHSVRFLDPAALRAALGVGEPDAAMRLWHDARRTPLDLPQLDAARATLDAMAPKAALERLSLLVALQRWHAEGRQSSQATRRDFAYFARANTKRISDVEWRWLSEVVDLSGFGIAAHAPFLLIAADFTLTSDTGKLSVNALPGFIGLPPQAIEAINRIDTPPACWRVIENRSAFEKAAASRANGEAVMWLPGYPPGWWRAAVAHLLGLAPAPLAIACDPDPDGIAIALHAAELWQAAGQAWTPWHMSATDLEALAHRRPLSDRDRGLLGTLRERTLPPTLATLADRMLELGEKGEQESLFW